MKKSDFLKLNIADLGRGLIVAAFTGGLTSLMQALQAGGVPTAVQFREAGLVAATSAVGYILKNFLTNSNGSIAKKEDKTV